MNGSVAFHAVVEGPRAFRVLRMSRSQIERLAEARLRWLLDHAARIEFYRPYIERAACDRSWWTAPGEMLRALPVVDKRALVTAGPAVLDGGRVRAGWFASRSSGSTGEPFSVRYDARAWALLKLLVKARSRWACGVRPWDRTLILDAFSPEKPPPANRFQRLHRVNVASKDTKEMAAEVAAFRPDVVYGLASVLLELADAAPGAIRPRTIFTSGELLTAGMRSSLESIYGARVLDVYGSSETKEVAWECFEGSLHINLDVVWVEVVDDDGRPLPVGSEGRLATTLLVNAAMPLIRYTTGDRGLTLPGHCPCGIALPRLGLVTGRETDYLDLGGGRRVSPYRLTCVMEEIPGIRRYQVVQRAPKHLSVRVEAFPETDPPLLESSIRDALLAIAPGELSVSVDFGAQFDHVPGGKFRVVQPLRRPPSPSR